MRKIIASMIDIFARLNRDIVAGIWQTALIMPLDCTLFVVLTGKPSYEGLDYRFWIFFSIYTVFFLLGYAASPIIRKHQFIGMLTNMVEEGNITVGQKTKILDIVKNTSRYAPLWSRDGFCLFFMENLYCFSIIFAFFGGEGLINASLNGLPKIVPILHLCFAVLCLFFEAKFDKYFAKKMREKYKMNNVKMFYGANKEITAKLIADITGDSSSKNLMNLHLESMLEDITDILDVSQEKEKAKKNQRKFGKTGIPKGRLEKAKYGIMSIKKKKKVKRNNKYKQKKKGKKKH
jgi:hypothetical protein